MVLQFLVKRYLDVFGYCFPFFWCRMLEQASQLYSKLETDGGGTFGVTQLVNMHHARQGYLKVPEFGHCVCVHRVVDVVVILIRWHDT